MDPARQPTAPDRKRKLEVIERPKAHESIWTIPLYRVIFHNDDKTSFQFVELACVQIFGMTPLKAVAFALEVDREGSAVAGVYAQEHAELKKEQTEGWARANKFPLMLSIEPEI
jgi:ATP-dependent Clp protease adaptor protein ClpS